MRGAGEVDEGEEEEELGRLPAEQKRGSSPRNNELQSQQVKEVEKAPIPPKTLECRLGFGRMLGRGTTTEETIPQRSGLQAPNKHPGLVGRVKLGRGRSLGS